MLLAIAVVRDGTIWGHKLGDDGKAGSDVPVSTVQDDGTLTVNTTTLASDVIGFAGPIPLNVNIKDGVIISIEILENFETPGFLDRAVAGIVGKYEGKAVSEALSMEVDAVSGATFSSEALKENIRRALDEASGIIEDNNGGTNTGGIDFKVIMALLVSLAAAIVPLVTKNKTYRTIQLVLNVLVLGIWTGTFVSYTSVVGYLSHGINLWKSLAAVVLLIVAFVYPLFGKKGHYCAWCCPLGSLQELAGKASRKKLAIGPKTINILTKFRIILWCVLMLLSWSGILFSWMDYEFFTAFLWQSASWIVIALAALTIVLSIFTNRPYCRFVCPTGTLIKL